MIKESQLLAKRLGLHFNQPTLFETALTHRSMGAHNNERLEFLGDSILGFVIAQKLYDSFPNASEGALSRLRASLVNQDSLANLARKHQVGDYLILGSGELKSGGFRRDSILSDAMEAIIGAIYKDQGIEICRQWILIMFAEELNKLTADNWKKDPKTQLQELMQSQGVDLPEYELVATGGLPHTQLFKITCRTQLTQEICIGYGSSRKKAEQSAAEQMLAILEREKK